MTPTQRLILAGIRLPEPSKAIACFEPCRIDGDLAYVSGQIPFDDEDARVSTGQVGKDLSMEEAVEAARRCALNILAQLQATLGTLDRVAQLLKLTVFVNSLPTFDSPHIVANGASEMLIKALGDAGHHARTAVCVASLPLGSSVEIEAVARIRPARPSIARIWHGRVPTEHAQAFTDHLHATAVREAKNTPGNVGVAVLRREATNYTHFMVITRWSSLDTVHAFAGSELNIAVSYPGDADFDLDGDPHAHHYEVVIETGEVR